MDFFAIALALLPGFTWLFFYLKEDLHPEPKSLLIMAFGFGILSAFFALQAQVVVNDYFLPIIQITKSSMLGVVVMALIEELSKFGAAYLAVKNSKDFDEPIDAMIYMVVAALGFATLENLGAIAGLSFSPTGWASISDIVGISSMRFVGATLLHTLASGILGYYWAKGIERFGDKKPLLLGIALATLLHTAFNYLIIISEGLTYSLVLVVVVGFFTLNDFEKLKGKAI